MNKLLKVSIPILLVLGLVLISGCAAPAGVPPPMPTPVPAPSPPKELVDEGGYPSTVPEEPTEERKIVKTGYITLEVEDIAESMDKVADMAEELGGYVVSSHKYEEQGGTSGSIRIRVPSERFEEAFERLRQFAVAVPYENTQAKDVTEEYVDLEARLRNLEATEAQYLALMEKAEEVEDMLMVQRELSNVREEIERIEGRMQYLERTSDMALIEINLQETKGLAAPWSASGAFKSAVRGLTAFGRGLATVIIWLGIFCWVWIPPLVIWLRRRRKAKAKIAS
jgi:hypothetical protein